MRLDIFVSINNSTFRKHYRNSLKGIINEYNSAASQLGTKLLVTFGEFKVECPSTCIKINL